MIAARYVGRTFFFSVINVAKLYSVTTDVQGVYAQGQLMIGIS